jgi:hypothetical protein
VLFDARSLMLADADLSFATGQLIVSNSVDSEYQGIASRNRSFLGLLPLLTGFVRTRRRRQHDRELLVSVPAGHACPVRD